jgi:hypothetical protein
MIEITCTDLIANSRQIFSSFFTGTGVVSTDFTGTGVVSTDQSTRPDPTSSTTQTGAAALTVSEKPEDNKGIMEFLKRSGTGSNLYTP